MGCCSVSRAAGSSICASSASTTIRDLTAAPGFAGESNANAPTRRPGGASFGPGPPGFVSPAATGLRSRTSVIPPWSLPSPWSASTPTACTGSQPTWKSTARRLPIWSIVFSLAIRLDRPSRSAQFGRAGWLYAIKRRWRKLDADWQLVVPTDLRVEPRAWPQPAFLRDRITGDETEFCAIALRPLEIVEAGPVKIAAHRDTGMDGAEHRREVRQHKFWPLSVSPVRDAVLGYENWQSLLLERTQQTVQAFGVQLPVQVRSGRSHRKHAFAKELSAIVTVEFHQLAGVVVQSEKVLARSRSAGAAGASQGEGQPAESK